MVEKQKATTSSPSPKFQMLKKHDKIRFTVQPDGNELTSRTNQVKTDPILTKFLTFLANDINENYRNVSAMNSDLLSRIRPLVSQVEIDLDSPLSDED